MRKTNALLLYAACGIGDRFRTILTALVIVVAINLGAAIAAAPPATTSSGASAVLVLPPAQAVAIDAPAERRN